MSTAQKNKEKKIPLRMCLGCRCMRPKRELYRIVKSSDGTVMFDTTQKMPGRGAYVCSSPECFERALKSKAIARALKSAVPDNIHESLRSAFNALIAANSFGATAGT